jgi:hypothetical protein
MTNFTQIPERALVLAGQVGENLKHLAPAGAGKWLDAGMKLGAVKAGTRVAQKVVMRHPAAVVAVAAGAGALWYLARRRAKQAENGAGDGNSTRVEAKRTRTTARKRARKTTATS